MFKLYWSSSTGAFAPEAVLTELDVPFSRIAVDTAKGEQLQEAYLAINPRGQIPALVLLDGTVLTETAAMLLHLADAHPQAGVAAQPGEVQRALTYRWLFFAAANIYESDLRWEYCGRYTSEPAGEAGVRTAAAAQLDRSWDLINREVAGPYFFGRGFTILDVYLAMLAGWHYDFGKLERSCPKVWALMQAVSRRPKIAPLWQVHYGHKPALQW